MYNLKQIFLPNLSKFTFSYIFFKNLFLLFYLINTLFFNFNIIKIFLKQKKIKYFKFKNNFIV